MLGTIVDTSLGRTLFVMAADAEYRDRLRAVVNPFLCGVGPVEAAVRLSFRVAGQPVDTIVSLGSAGSATLPQGAVREVSCVAYRDMDASAFGFERGVTPFADVGAVIPVVPALDVEGATLSTGANVVTGGAYAGIDADMVDMETWAIVRVCQFANLRFVGLRGISDGCEPVSRYEDWTDYLDAVDEGLAAVIRPIL